MASFVDKLRQMVSFTSGKGRKGAQGKDQGAALQALLEQFASCEDEALRAQLWQQLCKALPDTLFLAPMCYEGDAPAEAGRDRKLYATVGAKRLYESNEQIIRRGNPGYRLTEKVDGRRMHLRTLIAQKSKEVWVPLFTDFSGLLPMFGKNSRVTIITFAEARQMARSYTGIIINPGKESIRLAGDALNKTW